MRTHFNKTPKNKNHSTADNVSKDQLDNEPAFPFEDNRREATVQKKLK